MLLICALCSSVAFSGPLSVVTTTQDAAAMTREIGGEWVETESLTLGTRDPHFAQAKPSMIRKVARADLLVVIGASLEVGWLPALLNSARNRKVLNGSGYLDLSNSVQLLGVPTGTVTRAMGDVHPQGNPHYWLDPQNGILMAQSICAKLVDLVPEHRADFEANFKTFKQSIEGRLPKWQKAFSPLRENPVVAYHSSLEYLAKAFGFEIATEVEPIPGIPPSASDLNHLLSTIKQKDVRYLLQETYYDTKPGTFLKNKAKVHMIRIPQSVGSFEDVVNYADIFEHMAKEIRALSEADHG